MTHAHYMHDGGGSGATLSGRTQRELLAYLSSPELNSLDHVHDMWTDVAQRAGHIRELIVQRIDQLTAEDGWTGPGAEAYRSMITDDLIKHLATLEDTAQTYADKLDPVTGAVSASHTTGEQNNIPWDVQTQWHTRRQHVDQTFWGKVDELFTGDDDAYLEAKANAPTEVVTGSGAIVTTIAKPQWDATVAANPVRPVPSIFATVSTPVSQHQDQFDRLLEHHQLNSVSRANVQGAAVSVDSALSAYRPEPVPSFTYRGGAYSEVAVGGSVPAGAGGPGTSSPGGNGGTPPPAGGGTTPTPPSGGITPPPGGGGSGPGGTSPVPPGETTPGEGDHSFVPPSNPDPGVFPSRPGVPDPQVPIVDSGPGGTPDVPVDGIIGDPNPAPLPVGGTNPGTSVAGLPGIGSPMTSAPGTPPAMVATGSPVANTGGIGPMAAPGGLTGGPAGGAGRMPTGTPGTSFQMGPNGKAMVNPGSAGNIVGTGSEAGRGGMGSAAPIVARRNEQRNEDEKSDQLDEVWLEEDQNVWGAHQGAPPSVIR